VIKIITVEREYGSGGAAIAQKLADRLGWKLWDQALTAEIARLAKVDHAVAAQSEERCDPLFYRLLKVFLRGSFERSLPVRELDALDADSMVAMMERVIERAASAGNCVFVGRGAPYFLRNREDAFHVFVYAPLQEKIRRVRAIGKSEEEAIELIESVDRERATFIRKYFLKEWPTRQLYHLMINSKVGDELVVKMILTEIAALDPWPLQQGTR
jgi:cytidylate kinase